MAEKEDQKAVEGDEEQVQGEAEVEAAEEVFASAKDIPRPSTELDAVPKGKIGKFKIALIGEAGSSALVEEVEGINLKQASDVRTPLMTVILGILDKEGGTVVLEDLVEQVEKYWNRPFPASPYSKEEFIYTIVRDSDQIRVIQ
jgi:hypothetical protein